MFLPAGRPLAIALLVAGAFFMENLDGTVIATAMPQMARSFGASPVDLNIGMTAYLLALAVFIPISGWLTDRFGARPVFASAIGLFTVSSVLCGLSNGLWEFTAARILQGLGGAMMVPVGRLVVLRTTAKQDLLRFNCLYHLAWAGSTHIGPARRWFHYNLRFLALDLPPECPSRTLGRGSCPLAYSQLPLRKARCAGSACPTPALRKMQKLQGTARITSLQPPYSLIQRNVETEQLPWCRHENVGVIVYSPMASGLLTGAMTRERLAGLAKTDWRTRNEQFKEPKLSENLKLVERLRAVGARHGRSPGETAIAWTLRHPAVTGAIVGARNSKQVAGIIGAMDFRLRPSEIAEVEGQ